jgi:general L-amino acid transport system substrate-binding protein
MMRYLLPLLFSFTTVTSLQASTLEQVRQRDMLHCGISTGLPGFAEKDAKGQWTGFDVDMCRAVAAAVLEDASKVKYMPLTTPQRLNAVASGQVDMLARNTSWTLSRDLDAGLSFAGINYYDGQGFMIHRDKGLVSALQLNSNVVCVQKDTTSAANAQVYSTKNQLNMRFVNSETPEQNLKKLLAGECDVLSSDHSQLHGLRSQTKDPTAYKILPEVISKEPLSLVVKEGDDRWRKIVQWSLYIMINAESLGITQTNIDRIKGQANLQEVRHVLGLDLNLGKAVGLTKGWGYRIIKQVGNYSDVFERNIGSNSRLKISRGLNAPWSDGGLIYAPPIR